MQVDSVSGTSFGHVVYGSGVDKNILSNRLVQRNKIMQLQKVTKLVKDAKLDMLKNVDIILDYSKDEGFYGIISPKMHEIPNNPSYKCTIKPVDGSIGYFRSWANEWDSAYSPETLKALDNAIHAAAKDPEAIDALRKLRLGN